MKARTLSNKPLCVDLFAGLGGWAEGFLAEGFDCIGFDIERHVYGDQKYPAQLVLQDVRTLHGSQFRNAAVIVASPPCQEFSRYAMPFGALWLEHNRMDDDGGTAGNYQGKNTVNRSLFESCFRIQREACEAAGRHIPMVVENVKGAQRWVGRAAWHHGSYFLWGNIPALMPITLSNRMKCKVDCSPTVNDAIKQHGSGDAWFDKALDERRKAATAVSGRKTEKDGLGGYGGGFGWDDSPMRRGNSHSNARKAASAMIAKIPFELSAHIARCFKPV